MENALRSLDEHAARRRGVCLLAQALDQAHLKTSFEFAYLQTDRRLRQVEAPRRGREAPALDHLEKSPQLIEIEAAHAKLSLSKRLKHEICSNPRLRTNWSILVANYPMSILGENKMLQTVILTA